MTKKGHGRGNAHHGLTHKGEDGKESHGLGVEMQHVDLVMFKHHIEEGGERGIRPAQRASMKIGTSVAARAMRARYAGQATVSPHSLKLEAGIGRTLSMASSLSTKDRPTAGSTAGGALGEDRGFFPLSACFGAMAMGQAERKSDWKRKAGPRGSSEIGRARRGRRKNNRVRCGGRIARRILRQCGEAETPTYNQPPRVDQGRRILGPAVLRA